MRLIAAVVSSSKTGIIASLLEGKVLPPAIKITLQGAS